MCRNRANVLHLVPVTSCSFLHCGVWVTVGGKNKSDCMEAFEITYLIYYLPISSMKEWGTIISCIEGKDLFKIYIIHEENSPPPPPKPNNWFGNP